MAKKRSLVCFSCLFAIFLLCVCAFGVLTFEIPESISVFYGEELPSYPCFSLKEENEGSAEVRMFGLIPVKEIQVKKYDKISLIPGGFVFGVKVLSEGVTVAGFSEVTTGGICASPAKEAGICIGDVILQIDGTAVQTTADMTRLVEKSLGAPMRFLCRRGEEEFTFTVTPKKCDHDGRYKTGVWVRDASSGIGTVTFVDPQTGAFGGLGHGICEGESGKLLAFRRGAVTGVHISGITSGKPGVPGEIRGSLLGEKWGSLLSNTDCGVFGVLQSVPAGIGEAIPVGLSDEVKCGDAHILATLADGETRSYSVRISAIHHKEGTKCFTVKVTDPALLAKSGGIVQGMSGSPIIQNGKLVGAVTHVLINDPTTGYGIFIENMLSAAEAPMQRAA